MKFELNRLTDYSDESILNELRRVAEFLNEKPLLIEKFNKESRVSASTIIRHFGTWQTAILKAGLDSAYAARTKSDISKEEVTNELKRVSKLLNKEIFSQDEFLQHSICGHRGIRKNFGSYQNALKEAGFKSLPLGTRFTEEECFNNLLKLWNFYGRQPHYSEIKKENDSLKEPVKKGKKDKDGE